MEDLQISMNSGRLHVEGFPDAVKLAVLSDREARRLAHLALHRQDLEFAHQCAITLRNSPDQPEVIKQSLLRSSVTTWAKCFGNSRSRFSLSLQRIYSAGVQRDVANHYLAMRNKHFIHDENPFSQAQAGVVVAPPATKPQVQKVVCLSMVGLIGGDSDVTNIGLLIETALTWVSDQFDALADRIAEQLEKVPYSELMSMPDMSFAVPTGDDAHTTRPR
ncbi:hypothetical protein [Nucisporomicrobium flavum]|uniref:hypothetical protein n=1 Tax=Nucisporomicrobium flavum TaxID=2785915 RepID=UPI0018F6F00F|nr:hypothetical protein [Nucisporomicrobium flavum]